MLRRRILPVATILWALCGVAQAAPILDGATIQTTYLFPDTGTLFAGPTNSVVGPGVELLNFAGFVNIDFSDTNILITANRNAGINDVAFDGFRFFDLLGIIRDDLVATINPATNYAGFDASRFAGGDANTLFVNVANLPGLRGQVISIDLAPRVAAVPEPTSLLLLGAGGLGLIAMARRRKKHQAKE